MKIEMGIGWVPDEEGPKGHIRSALPGEYATEIVRLRGLLHRMHDWASASNDWRPDSRLSRDVLAELDGGPA